MRLGLTETELWALLQTSVIEQDGNFCKTGLLDGTLYPL